MEEMNLNRNYAARKVQQFWRKNTSITTLTYIKDRINTSLGSDGLQELSNKLHAIKKTCKGDGAGLSGGILMDMFLCEYFEKNIPEYEENHTGESDMKICGTDLSQKKINGKSTIALDWSKNEIKTNREHFSCHLMILNLTTEQWWKTTPKERIPTLKISYNDIIPAGIYFVDKQFCKYYIKLSKNNKTDTLIESKYLYGMLKRSINQDLCITLPPPNEEDMKFTLLNAFSKSK
jgi:hypothetical protein